MKGNTERKLGISPSVHGFGYTVMEGNDRLVAFGNKRIKGKDKNERCFAHIEKLVSRYWPDILILPDVKAKGTRHAKRIIRLQEKILMLAKQRRLKTKTVSVLKLRERLLGDGKVTKHQVAEFLAQKFPEELASQIPPKRRFWMNEDPRMDIFAAVALVVSNDSIASR